MIEDPLDPTAEGPSADDSTEEQHRLLELQLFKVRREAAAARLEARAAEIEWTIRRLANGHRTIDPSEWLSAHPPEDPSPKGRRERTPDARPSEAAPTERVNHDDVASVDAFSGDPPTLTPTLTPLFGSWDEVRSARQSDSTTPPKEPPVTDGGSEFRSTPSTAEPAAKLRFDSAETAPRRPNVLDVSDAPADAETEPETLDPVTDPPNPATAIASLILKDSGSRLTPPDVAGEVSIEENSAEHDGAEKRSKKPTALLVSMLSHVGVLAILAAITLQTRIPRDQVALSASTTPASEPVMETFTIEANEPEPESEPPPSPTAYQWNPVGEIAATEITPDTLPGAVAAEMKLGMQKTAAAKSLLKESDAKIQFCGVEGGGNHFVYLVDSSKSMGDGFESARRALLSSIEALKPDQRFYVVFFDAEPDYMRLNRADRDEPRSVSASPKNVAALKRWAMRISMDNGRAPYDPLQFALKLKPDVIFLLSDGEFPQGIEDLLAEGNRKENLFGDRGPVSIVHTISYHSQEGESRMRRIAEQNKGQYRHVPKQ